MMSDFNQFLREQTSVLNLQELKLVKFNNKEVEFVDPVRKVKVLGKRGIDPKTKELKWFFRVEAL